MLVGGHGLVVHRQELVAVVVGGRVAALVHVRLVPPLVLDHKLWVGLRNNVCFGLLNKGNGLFGYCVVSFT